MCVFANLPTPLVLCSFSAGPPDALENTSNFSVCSRNHERQISLSACLWMKSLAVFGLLCKRRQRTGPWTDGQVASVL